MKGDDHAAGRRSISGPERPHCERTGELARGAKSDRLIVEPVRKGLALLAALELLEEQFPDVDEDLVPLNDVEL